MLILVILAAVSLLAGLITNMFSQIQYENPGNPTATPPVPPSNSFSIMYFISLGLLIFGTICASIVAAPHLMQAHNWVQGVDAKSGVGGVDSKGGLKLASVAAPVNPKREGNTIKTTGRPADFLLGVEYTLGTAIERPVEVDADTFDVPAAATALRVRWYKKDKSEATNWVVVN